MACPNELRLTLPMETYEGEYNVPRRRTLLMFASILDECPKFKELDYAKQRTILVEMERSCFLKTLAKCKETAIYPDWSNDKLVYMYSLIASRVSKNLDVSSEVQENFLIEAIISGDCSAEDVASLSSEEMSPEMVNKIKEQIASRRSQKIKQKTTNMYTCRNCKSRECTIRTQQMRSLDEGFTIILNCVNCGYRFMVGG